jgi:hypothetical protein
MDGGIDKAYMNMFPGIQQILQSKMRSSSQTPTSILGRKYFPLGSSMIHEISNKYSIISALLCFFHKIYLVPIMHIML